MSSLFKKFLQKKSPFRQLIYGFAATSSYLGFLYLTDDGVKPTNYPEDFNSTIYKQLPFTGISQVYATIAHWKPPKSIKDSLIKGFIWLNDIDLSECDVDVIDKSSSLSEFFCRPLRSGCRNIDSDSCLVSPCDSVVLTRGTVNDKNPYIPQVKGSTFSVDEFLGPLGYKVHPKRNEVNKGVKTSIYYCVLYLSPKDYHRFHVPADWRASYRRYFPGKLLPVRPSWSSKLPGLFSMNERVCYIGQWGPNDLNWLMTYTAVAAFLVGSIKIPKDVSFEPREIKEPGKKFIDGYFDKPMELKKGEEFGAFEFGSTIVLMFEAPENLEWNVGENEKVKMGQSLIKTKL